MKNNLLLIGLGLSIIPKLLQWRYVSIWGDLLIIPAAVFLVLSLLLHLPTFNQILNDPSTQKSAKLLAGFCCLAVVSFQLFTMFTFGREASAGWFFLLPVLLFTAGGYVTWKSLV